MLQFPDGSAYGYLPDYLVTMLGFAASFWWTVFLIHKLARTSFRDFVLGSGGCQHRLTGQTYAELSLP